MGIHLLDRFVFVVDCLVSQRNGGPFGVLSTNAVVVSVLSRRAVQKWARTYNIFNLNYHHISTARAPFIPIYPKESERFYGYQNLLR